MALLTKPNMQQIWASGGDVVEPTDLKKQQGWTVEVPPHQFENWIQKRQDEYLAHVNQRGIPAWDALTEYEAGGLSYTQGSDGKIYKSVAASGPSTTTQNPTTDVSDTYWTIAFADVGAFLTQIAGDARYLQLSLNGSDIPNAVTFRTNLGVFTSSETVSGLVELATSAETITGTDTTRAVHPAGLAALTSTDTRRGLVELATNAETVTGTDAVRAVTPAGLTAAFEQQPLSKVYESAELAFSAGAAFGPLAHGLGAVPKFLTYEYRCIVADAGYAIGDRVFVSQSMTTSAGDGATLVVDATNLIGRWGSVRVGTLLRKDTGGTSSLTGTSWRVVVRAYI